MMMRLQRYNIRVTYKRFTSLALVDTLSRAPLPTVNDSKQMSDPMSDPTLCSLNRVIITGWPSRKSELPQSLHPHWNYREELTSQDGVIYKGSQVLIPLAKTNFILQKAHAAHFGAESNIRLCKDTVFWPGMKSDIREACRSCGKCAQFQIQNSKEPMKSQPVPEYPWQFVSQDLCCG